MKQAIKLLLSFLGGAVVATTVISFFLPPRLVSDVSVVGGFSPIWSLEAFERINREMPKLVKDPNFTMTVIPTQGGDGYEILVSDNRLRVRFGFGFASWDPSIERIKERMDQLAENKNTAEQAGTGQPATRHESDSEGSDKPQPESEGRSR